MTVIDDLPRRKNGWHHFGAVQYGIQTAFKNTNKILACIAAAANSFELPLHSQLVRQLCRSFLSGTLPSAAPSAL